MRRRVAQACKESNHNEEADPNIPIYSGGYDGGGSLHRHCRFYQSGLLPVLLHLLPLLLLACSFAPYCGDCYGSRWVLLPSAKENPPDR